MTQKIRPGQMTKVWWEELGRNTLSSTGDLLSVTSIPVRRYLKVVAVGLATGNIGGYITFNNDGTVTNYNRRRSTNGGADAADAGAFPYFNLQSASLQFLEMDIVNIAAKNKLAMIKSSSDAGDGVAPTRSEMVIQWENNTDAITRIDWINDDTGSFVAGSELVVLGHD
jgi:hypothetical protein